jgi:hypothetical protein
VIDRSFIGLQLTPIVTHVERGRLRSFAKAIGETNPVYLDTDAARRAGFRDIPVPPTYPFCLEMLGAEDPFELFKRMNVPLGKVLHGEQFFTYHATICAGDRVTMSGRVVDIYDKKHGALEFIVQDTEGRDENGHLMVELRRVVVIRN